MTEDRPSDVLQGAGVEVPDEESLIKSHFKSETEQRGAVDIAASIGEKHRWGCACGWAVSLGVDVEGAAERVKNAGREHAQHCEHAEPGAVTVERVPAIAEWSPEVADG